MLHRLIFKISGKVPSETYDSIGLTWRPNEGKCEQTKLLTTLDGTNPFLENTISHIFTKSHIVTHHHLYLRSGRTDWSRNWPVYGSQLNLVERVHLDEQAFVNVIVQATHGKIRQIAEIFYVLWILEKGIDRLLTYLRLWDVVCWPCKNKHKWVKHLMIATATMNKKLLS